MKTLFLLSGLFLFFACGSQKEVAANTVNETSENVEDTAQDAVEDASDTMDDNFRIVGTVHTIDKGCGVYIDAKLEDRSVKMYPVNLDEKFSVEGMFIRFTYAPSRAMQPSGCKCDRVVSLSDVTPLRK
ncbi:MAG: hypothetical protein MK105_08810 [Crocinitomicaceae bacterium]|nr:hypothetical protein [Crocinitomicaceae bacterium]